MADRDRIRSAFDWIEKAPPAEWVREMREHYRRTGEYRPRDIRRVVGDQTESVKIQSDPIQSALKLAR